MLSVVIPIYNEEKSIIENIKIINGILDFARIPHEFVLVDDGSKDNTWQEIVTLVNEFDFIRAIKLSRNFGKENALCAGLDAVQGDCCVVMDSDLQHPPESIIDMYTLWKDKGFEVVEGVKTFRGKESIFQKLSAKLFYKTLKTFSGIDLDNASDFRLMDRVVVEAWKAMPERQTFFRAMSTWVGFSRTQVFFTVQPRKKGSSGWNVFRLFKLAFNAITAFSTVPLQIATFAGGILFVFFLFMMGQTLYMKLNNYAVEGFTTVILLLLIIGSLLMISNGIIGIYISKIYEEVKQRPRYLVQKVIGKPQNKF
ncbi:MAG: glycosyltransferase family 2 protein [Bacillota bacterium]